MLAGMLLGVIFYRPIYQYFLDSVEPKNIKGELPFMKGSPAYTLVGLQNGDSLRTTTARYAAANGLAYTTIISDTIKAGGLKAAGPVAYKNRRLSSGLYWQFVALVFFQVLLVTMVYGPVAAFLVELFPTKIRYTSMSLPYHIGNGVFGGLVPFIGLLLTTSFPKDPMVGLWYPIGIAALCFVIGALYLNNRIESNVNG
jgi:MFS family permease